MLVSRTLFRDWVQRRFASELAPINEGFAREGGFYLFGLRMVPLFPFFVVNLVMGITPISVWQYYWVSQVGMLAGTAVFVFAGTQLATLTSLDGILNPGLIAAFALVGLFPLAAKWIMKFVANRRADASV